MKAKQFLCQVACWALKKQRYRSPRSCSHIGFCNFMGTRVSSLPSCLYLFNSPLGSHISRATRSILWFLLVSDQNSSISSPKNPFSIEEPKTTLWCHSQAENPPPTPHSPENNSRAPCPGWQGSLKLASAHSSESHPLTHHLQLHCPSLSF